MNKEVLSDYGWILICVIIISILLAFTSPLGDFFTTSMDETTDIIIEQSTKNPMSKEKYFNYNAGTLTVKKEYKNAILIKNAKEVKIVTGINETSQALCHIISDGNATTIMELEEYLMSQGLLVGTLDEYLLDKYGLNFEDLVKLIDGDKTYLLPKDLIIPSLIDDQVVRKIDKEAFADCINLTSVVIPATVNTIDDYAFANCESLSEVKFGNSVEYIGNGAFYCCKNITSLSIPNSIDEIGAFAFGDCEGLLSVKIYDHPDVVTLDSDAFGGTCRISTDEIKWIY